MERVDKPKVFISYAWTSEEYKDKVLSFAAQLIQDGVDVLLDRYQAPGTDLIAFMERSVNDESVMNVLILMDEGYAAKANKRQGGVGTEAQIISPEIYDKVEQTKFIPVLFDLGKNGERCVPTFLKSRKYIDLTDENTFEQEYKDLVKQIYGVHAVAKPTLGTKPAWVDSEPIVPVQKITAYKNLANYSSEKERSVKITEYLNSIKNDIVEAFNQSGNYIQGQALALYENAIPLRDEFLFLLKQIICVENTEDRLCDFFEELHTLIYEKYRFNWAGETANLFVNELFIYTIAVYYKNHFYKELSRIFTRPYFCEDDSVSNFTVFRVYSDCFQRDMNARDEKNYNSGAAEYWTKNINTEICTKEEFVFADILAYNCSVYGNIPPSGYYWYPVSYIYSGLNQNKMKSFSTRLQSLAFLTNAAEMFGYNLSGNFAEQFRTKCKIIEEKIAKGEFDSYRYPAAFNKAPLLSYYIKCDRLGTMR